MECMHQLRNAILKTNKEGNKIGANFDFAFTSKNEVYKGERPFFFFGSADKSKSTEKKKKMD